MKHNFKSWFLIAALALSVTACISKTKANRTQSNNFSAILSLPKSSPEFSGDDINLILEREKIKKISHKKWPETVKAHNKKALAQLPMLGTGPKVLSKNEAQTVHDEIRNSPVVSDKAILGLGVKNIGLGFCFAKATALHLEINKQRLAHPEKVYKVWITGPMLISGVIWDFHVALLVPAENGKWWALDALEKEPVMLEQWLDRTKALSLNSKSDPLMVFITNSSKLSAASGAYSEQQLSRPEYQGLFRRLNDHYSTTP